MQITNADPFARKNTINSKITEFKQEKEKSQCVRQIRQKYYKAMREIYKTPDCVSNSNIYMNQAFATMDYSGRGYITMQDLIPNMMVHKLGYPKEKLEEFFINEKYFEVRPQMDFDQFKKAFFPHLFQVDVNENYKKGTDPLKIKADDSQEQQQDKAIQRLRIIEAQLKKIFSNQWKAVRKAFLDLDQDYDGYITAEDIANYFARDNRPLDFTDLKMCIKSRDRTKTGKMDYNDFCRWMGNAIYPCQDFYFRHDSIRNPAYEEIAQKISESKLSKDRAIVGNILTNVNLEEQIMSKIQSYWKTIKKAFVDMDRGRKGEIDRDELYHYVVSLWGFQLTDEQFQSVFDFLDCDRDGKISYLDFQKSVGHRILPSENLFFRQDLPPTKYKTCKMNNCWDQAKFLGSEYCHFHSKILGQKSNEILIDISKKVKNFKQFLVDLKQMTSTYKGVPTLKFDDLCNILRDHSYILSDFESDCLFESFILKDQALNRKIDATQFFLTGDSQKIKKVYEGIEMNDQLEEEEIRDYTTVFNGGVQGMKFIENPVSLEELLKIIKEKPRLKQITEEVKRMDIDHNGFITNSELNIMFQNHYEEELNGKSLIKILRPFSSVQNRVLINYRAVFKFLNQKLSEEVGTQIGVTHEDIERIKDFKENLEKASDINQSQYNNQDYQHNQLKSQEGFNKARSLSPSKFQTEQPSLDLSPLKIQKPRGQLKLPEIKSSLQSPRKLKPKFSETCSNFNTTTSFQKINPLSNAIGKLQYEWKNIIRYLKQIDVRQTGIVSQREFEQIVHQNGVYLLKDDLKKIYQNYTEGKNGFNYEAFQADEGIKKQSYDFMRSKYNMRAQIVSLNPQYQTNKLQETSYDFGKYSERKNSITKPSAQKTIQYLVKNNTEGMIKVMSQADQYKTGIIDKNKFNNIMKFYGINMSQTKLNEQKGENNGIDYQNFLKEYGQ